MNETIDELLAESTKQTRKPSEPPAQQLSKEDWAAKKKQTREDAYALVDKGAESIIMSPPMMEQYLSMQTRFLHYSVSNVLLIMQQCPDATQLKNFDGWKEVGASIKKGTRGITILEPGKQYTGADGKTKTSFDPKTVFDISQTTAAPEKADEQPSYAEVPAGMEQRPVARAMLLALIRQSPVEIESVSALEGGPQMGACYQHQLKRIQVQRGMPAEALFQALTCEIVHAEFARDKESYSRAAYNYQARCAAFLVCRHYQVDASCFNVRNAPATTSGLDAQQMRQQLSVIRDVAGRITNRMDKNLSYDAKQTGKER